MLATWVKTLYWMKFFFISAESMKESESMVIVGQLLGFKKQQEVVYKVVIYMFWYFKIC